MGALAVAGDAPGIVYVFRRGDGVDTISDPQSGDTIVIYGYASYELVVVGQQLRIVLDEDNYIILTQRVIVPGGGMPQIILAPDEQRGTEDDDVLTGTAILDDIEGLGGNDVLSGLEADDILDGGDGDDRLAGGAGDDQLIGGAGFDTADYGAASGGVTVDLRLSGAQDTNGAGIDTLDSIEGVIGSAFADNIVGSTGDNVLRGGGGADRLNGGLGNDQLEGGDGDDVLNGGDDNDYIVGGAGADLITGGGGDDIIDGGSEADLINGGAGNDTLTGGFDGDVFAYTAGLFGADVIDDWQDGIDLIQFNYAAVDDISDLTIADDGSGNALITAPDGSTITLTGINFATLDASDFIFGP